MVIILDWRVHGPEFESNHGKVVFQIIQRSKSTKKQHSLPFLEQPYSLPQVLHEV